MSYTTLRVERPTEIRNGFMLTAAPEDNARKVVKVIPTGIEFPIPLAANASEGERNAWEKAKGAYMRLALAQAGVSLKGFSWYFETGGKGTGIGGFMGVEPVTVNGIAYKTVWVEPVVVSEPAPETPAEVVEAQEAQPEAPKRTRKPKVEA